MSDARRLLSLARLLSYLRRRFRRALLEAEDVPEVDQLEVVERLS